MELWQAPEWETLRHPCNPDHRQLLEALGVSPLAPPAVLEVVRRASTMPYPPHWSEEVDASSGVMYFYHELQDKSSWHHPLADTFREVLEVVENVVVDESLGLDAVIGCIEQAMTEAKQRAVEDLADWMGPLDDAVAKSVYFYNQRTACSEWEDPCQRWRYDLQVRYDLLAGFFDFLCENNCAEAIDSRVDDKSVYPQDHAGVKEVVTSEPQHPPSVSDWIRRLSPRTIAMFCSAATLAGGNDVLSVQRRDLGCLV